MAQQTPISTGVLLFSSLLTEMQWPEVRDVASLTRVLAKADPSLSIIGSNTLRAFHTQGVELKLRHLRLAAPGGYFISMAHVKV